MSRNFSQTCIFNWKVLLQYCFLYYDLDSTTFRSRSVKIPLSMFVMLAFGSAPAQAASFDCVEPDFPAQSTSSEGVRRVEKQVRQWRACKASHRSEMGSAEVERLSTEVDARLAKWIASTRAYSNRQASGQRVRTEIEQEKAEYGAWLRGAAPAEGPPAAGKL